MELRVIIAGGRDFNNFSLLMDKCIEIIKLNVEDVKCIRIISGGARGADLLGEQFANITHYELSKFPANWDLYGKSAGYCRNTEMAKFAVKDGNRGLLVAFWNGKSRGTKHMFDVGKHYGLWVEIVSY